MLHFEFLTSDDQLLDAGPAWQALGRDAGTAYQVFQDWQWVRSWWECVAPLGRHELRILVASADNRIVLIWPWVIDRRRGLRVLEAPGGLLSCFDDALLDPPAASADLWAQAWQFLLGNTDVDAIELRGVHERASIAPFLSAVGGTPIATTAAPVIDLAAYQDFDAYLAGRSKKMRQNQRRSHKYLAARGKLRGSGDDQSLAYGDALQTALAFKARWLEARGLSGKTLMTATGRTFLERVGRRYRADPAGPEICISSLYLDDAPISIGLGLRHRNHHFEYLGGFDYRLEHFGPGRLRMEYGIRSCFDAGIAGYDMLTPATRFKTIWTGNAPAVAHYVIPRSLSGRLYRDLYLRTLRPRLKKLYHALPATLKEPLTRRRRRAT